MGDIFTVDIELTNRCNAKCHFCPRDQTPHQGLMSPEAFTKSLERTLEFSRAFPGTPLVVSLCGLGEPLLNRHAPTFVRQVREAGLTCAMSSNASLLDETRAHALLEAGLQQIYINVGERDEEYEQVYKLSYERTRVNIERFIQMAKGRCDVEIVLVDHRADPDHLRRMEDYWRERGVNMFLSYGVINRGGALFVDHMQFESYSELQEAKELLKAEQLRPVCAAPFAYLFIGYDGRYYLCCSDWKKEVPLGSVFETSFLSIGRQKLEHVLSREPICKSCNHDPTNRLTEELRSISAGENESENADRLVTEFRAVSQRVDEVLEQMEAAPSPAPVAFRTGVRRRIALANNPSQAT